MKTWLHLTLITVSVGGGFHGVALSAQALFSPQTQPLAYILILVFLTLFAFVTVSGLIFVHNPQRKVPLVLALAIQIPWVSSPLIAYRFATGFQVFVAMIGGAVSGSFRFGSECQIYFFHKLPLGAGVNLFAVALLVLLLHATRVPEMGVQEPTIESNNQKALSETCSQI